MSDITGNVVITGQNATGKSSILEAVQLLSMLESFRTSEWQNLVRTGSETCQLRGVFTDDDRLYEVAMTVVDGKRNYLFNGKRRRLGDMTQNVPLILFTPDDLNLVKGSAEQRRLCVDDLGKKISRNYYLVLSDYHKTLRQRNAILKERRKAGRFDKPGSEEMAWEERLAELGARLTVLRFKLFRRLVEQAALHYGHLSGGEVLTSEYVPSFWRTEGACFLDLPESEALRDLILQGFERRRTEEYVRGITLTGPHRDEISFYVDGREARGFVSQGQQRSIALAVKIAEFDVIRELSDKEAILLLDDVLSELDLNRRERLLRLCSEVTQSFITTTDLSAVPGEFLVSGTLIELGLR